MTVPARREPPFPLPHLTAFDEVALAPGREYDAIEFVARDFAAQDASDARFLECRLERCSLDGVRMTRTRILGSLLSDVRGVSVELADSTWRDARITGSRLGAVMLAGATLTGVRVLGTKLDFVNLAGAVLDDVVFDACEIGTLDARAAQLRSVSFIDCSMDELNVAGATLAKVDLSGARLRSLVGVESIRGAIVNHEQLVDLAPLLAAELGLEVHASSD